MKSSTSSSHQDAICDKRQESRPKTDHKNCVDFVVGIPGMLSRFSIVFHFVFGLAREVNTDQISTAVFGGVKTEVTSWGHTQQPKFAPRLGG